MELEQLRLFLTAAEKGSFSAAARSLYISHSTVSRCISALEEEFGTVLFERSGNSVIRLTEKGEILKAEAEKLLRQADEIRDKLKQQQA